MKDSKNDILLSFILPVYNVEEYLEECVDSILSQINEECEIILVDDGATDTSGDICDRYAQDNPIIKVIHKENGGLSSARNAGIPVAQGKYISFVDSDDAVFLGCVSEILRWIKSEATDICFLQAVKFYPDGTEKDLGECIVRSELKGQDREHVVAHLASRPKYPGSAWAKLYRREFLLENDLHFPYDRRYSEDLGFILDCVMSAESFDVLDVPYYRYRQNRAGSITNRITSRNFFDLLTFICESVQKLTIDKKPRNPICGHAMGFVAYEYSVLILIYNRILKQDRREALKRLKEYKWVLKFSANRKCRLVSTVSSICGIRLTSLLLKKYRKATVK